MLTGLCGCVGSIQGVTWLKGCCVMPMEEKDKTEMVVEEDLTGVLDVCWAAHRLRVQVWRW